jgi:adenylate kinase family enzyme
MAQNSSQTTPQPLGGLDHEALITLMQQRQLLPTETIVSIVGAALRAISKAAAASGIRNPIILVDGFPRSLESAAMAEARWGAPQAVLLFDCLRELAEARFLKRKRSADDSAEIFRKRYDEFERLIGEIMEMYKDIVVRVDTKTGIDESWESLHDRVSDLMEKLGGIKGGVSHET